MKLFTFYIGLILGFFLAGNGLHVSAQQIPQYTNYINNYPTINPAMLGAEECVLIKVGARSQWLKFEGAPRGSFFTVGGRLKLNRIISNRTYHGWGIKIEGDEIGAFSKTSFNGGYSFHFQVHPDVWAAFGIYAGMHQFKFDAQKINAYDPLMYGSDSEYLMPDIIPGFMLVHKDWFIGYNSRYVYRTAWKVVGTELTRNVFHHQLVAGKRVKSTEDITVVPSFMLKYVGYSKPALDLTVDFELRKHLELGIGYRNGDAVCGLIKLKAKKISLGYSFDYTLSRMRIASSNTHEVIISYSSCEPEQSIRACPIFD